MNKKLRVVLVRPLAPAIEVEIDGSLRGMQKVVDGYIQAIYPFEDPVALVCNEEAKLQGGLLPNRALYDDKGEVYDIIVGDFFLCLAPPDSSEFESLPDDLINKYLKHYERPELFIWRNGKINIIR